MVTTALQEITWGVWIGLTRSDYYDTFRWVDNGPLNYENWGIGAPSASQVISELRTQNSEICLFNTFFLQTKNNLCMY